MTLHQAALEMREALERIAHMDTFGQSAMEPVQIARAAIHDPPLHEEPAQGNDLRKAIAQLLAWLKDERLSKWPYMENGQFYTDLRSNIDYLERVISEPAHPAPDVDVTALLDVTIDPGDGTIHSSLQYVLLRGFHAMGWQNPKMASEDMAAAIVISLRRTK